MLSTKYFTPIAVIALLAASGIWIGTRGSATSGRQSACAGTEKSRNAGAAESAAPSIGSTRASTREGEDSSATHRPERLKDFILPEVVIDGLELEAALEKVFAAYQDACVRSGETALSLRFVVPQGNYRKLHLRLKSRNFRSSVQLLATLSGMRVSRHGLEYRFTKVRDERRTTKRTLQVPPDFNALLQEATTDPGMRMRVGDQLARLGLELDSSTVLTFDVNGRLTLETNSSADAAAVSALVRMLTERPHQQKFTSVVVELPAGSDWTPPDLNQMDSAAFHEFMRAMAQRKDTHLMTLPSITARDGQSATIEISHQLMVPTNDAGTTIEAQPYGVVMNIQGSALGFGNDVAFDYTHTVVNSAPSVSIPTIDKQTEVTDSGFTDNHGTRFAVQTRPDGSRAIVLLTSNWIDATGRPLD